MRQIDTRNVYHYHCTAYNVESIRQQLAARGYERATFTSLLLPNVDGAGVANALLGIIVQPLHMVPRSRLRLEPIAIQRSLSIRTLSHLNGGGGGSDPVQISFKNEMLSERWLHTLIDGQDMEKEGGGTPPAVLMSPDSVVDWGHLGRAKRHTIEPKTSAVVAARRLTRIKSNKMEQLQQTVSDEWENNIYIDGSSGQWGKLERKCSKLISDIPPEENWQPIRTMFEQTKQFCAAVRKHMTGAGAGDDDDVQRHQQKSLKPFIQEAFLAILPPETICGWIGTFDINLNPERTITSFHHMQMPVFNEALLVTTNDGKRYVLEHIFAYNTSLNGYLSKIVRSQFREGFSLPREDDGEDGGGGGQQEEEGQGRKGGTEEDGGPTENGAREEGGGGEEKDSGVEEMEEEEDGGKGDDHQEKEDDDEDEMEDDDDEEEKEDDDAAVNHDDDDDTDVPENWDDGFEESAGEAGEGRELKGG